MMQSAIDNFILLDLYGISSSSCVNLNLFALVGGEKEAIGKG